MRPKFNSIIDSIKSFKPGANGGALVPLVEPEPKVMPSDRHQIHWNTDGSPSMEGFLNSLFAGMKRFGNALRKDAFLNNRVDITVWAMDDQLPAKRLVDAAPAERFETPRVATCSHSPVYESMALVWEDAIHRKRRLATQHDCDVATSWAFLFSDCGATDLHARDKALAMQSRAREAGVNTFVLTLGEVDDVVAQELSDRGRPPIALESVEDFTKFFTFLRQSLRTKSMSMPGQPLRLEFNGQQLEADA